MRDRIEITKELIPYTFEISLADEIFTITVNYNAYADMFTFSLEKDGETVCAGAVSYTHLTLPTKLEV